MWQRVSLPWPYSALPGFQSGGQAPARHSAERKEDAECRREQQGCCALRSEPKAPTSSTTWDRPKRRGGDKSGESETHPPAGAASRSGPRIETGRIFAPETAGATGTGFVRYSLLPPVVRCLLLLEYSAPHRDFARLTETIAGALRVMAIAVVP